MKKLFFVASLSLAFMSLSAQTEKGNWYFGGDTSLGFASTNSQAESDGKTVGDKLTVSKLSFKPSANYFVIDNLSVGLGILFESTTEKDGSDSDTVSTTAILPGVKYFFNSGNSFVPYVGVGAGLISVSAGDYDEEKYSGFAFGANGGFAYFVNESVSLNVGLTYLNSNMKNKKESSYVVKSGAFGVIVGFGIFL